MEFTPEVARELQHYVYRLIDPRNGETFYVGKGQGNRVFTHASGEIAEGCDELSDKLKRIREIRNAGLPILHVIHRHGMSKEMAFEVEAALMEAFPGVTNIAGGHGNVDRGVSHAQEIIERYTAQEAEITDPCVEIIVNRSASDKSLYDATRFAWKLSAARAARAQYVLAVINGLVVGVFAAEAWLPATPENFPSFGLEQPIADRYGFVGAEIQDPEVLGRYLRRKVPPRARGAANPVRYFNI